MTTHDRQPEPGRADGAAKFGILSRLAGSSGGQGLSQAWMITFTDLVALLLAFFVLLFSMSQIEQKKWEGLVNSLASDFNSLKREKTAPPAIDYHPDEEAPIPGTDLDYLTPLLAEQIAAQSSLAESTIRQQANRLILALPAGQLFRPNATTLRSRAEEAGFALGGVLRNLTNRIEVVAYVRAPKAGGTRSHWQLAVARAAQLAELLARAGYDRPIISRGLVHKPDAAGGTDAKPGSLPRERVEIVIHELAGGVS